MATLSYPGVYMEEVSSGVHPIAAAGTSTAAFVGVTERGPTNEAVRITSWTQYQRVYGSFVKDYYLPESVFQFFNNGGQQCYIVRVVGDNAKEASAEETELAMTFQAKNKGKWGNNLRLKIEKGTDGNDGSFKVCVWLAEKEETKDDELTKTSPLEVYDNLTVENIVTVLEYRSNLIAAKVTTDTKPPSSGEGDSTQGTDSTSSELFHLTGGIDDNSNGVDDLKKGFVLLDKITDFSLLAVPGVGEAGMMNEGMTYCSNRPLQDVFYIGEMSRDEDEPGEAETFKKSLTNPNSYGALYYPWIKAADPSGKSREPVLLPPSGFIAGLYARIDSKRGVWKAPAGTEATLGGAVGLAYNLTDVEQGNLNLKNINCIRRFAASGIVSWGARTITSDTEWNYVPVRRMAIMLRVSIYNGIQWAVFEPNDEDLWGQLRLNLNSFMMTLFRKGAFQGTSPSQAFFVKCDAETTTQADIDLGIVNVLVGFAPLKPAEFVVVRISQKAGQAS